MSVKDTDQGYADFMKGFESLNGLTVFVGIHQEDDTNSAGGASYVEIALFNEFGTEDIPDRPFLTSTAEEKRNEWAALSGKLFGRVLDGKIFPRTALELLGAKAQADVRQKIVTLREPANRAATIARKGSDNPLIDTGTMRRLITYKVTKVPK